MNIVLIFYMVTDKIKKYQYGICNMQYLTNYLYIVNSIAQK